MRLERSGALAVDLVGIQAPDQLGGVDRQGGVRRAGLQPEGRALAVVDSVAVDVSLFEVPSRSGWPFTAYAVRLAPPTRTAAATATGTTPRER